MIMYWNLGYQKTLVLDDPSWLLENIGIGYDYDVERI